MRWRKKPGVAAALAGEAFKDLVLRTEETAKQPLPGSWSEIFGNMQPLHVELGTGKGNFITELAARERKTVNFIGIESQQDVLYYAALKAQARELTNLRLLVCDAACLPEIFPLGKIERIYVNFCDPWPKNRHARRRLTDERFLALYRQVLRPGGQLFFKTDNEKLFEFSLNQFAAAGLRLSNITFDLHNSGKEDNVMTEYEMKFSGLGMKIYRCEAAF